MMTRIAFNLVGFMLRTVARPLTRRLYAWETKLDRLVHPLPPIKPTPSRDNGMWDAPYYWGIC
jgi:hypothetical protein